jgi:hypothetical protein
MMLFYQNPVSLAILFVLQAVQRNIGTEAINLPVM